MGYCMSQRNNDFSIPAGQCDAAHKALLAATSDRWNDQAMAEELAATSFVDAVWLAFQWELVEEPSGDISGICFGGDKAGEDETLFEAIAPFVISGSFIEMIGQDGTLWRWVFTDGTVEEIVPEMHWGSSLPVPVPPVEVDVSIDVSDTIKDLVRLRSELR